MLASPEIQVVSVCDPCKNPSGYRDWSRDSLLKDIRRGLNKPDWRAGGEGIIPGGRDVGQNVVDTFYGTARAAPPTPTIASCWTRRKI